VKIELLGNASKLQRGPRCENVTSVMSYGSAPSTLASARTPVAACRRTARVGIDEPSNQPWTRKPIDLRALARDPPRAAGVLNSSRMRTVG
jgi:hypothetical protein